VRPIPLGRIGGDLPAIIVSDGIAAAEEPALPMGPTWGRHSRRIALIGSLSQA